MRKFHFPWLALTLAYCCLGSSSLLLAQSDVVPENPTSESTTPDAQVASPDAAMPATNVTPATQDVTLSKGLLGDWRIGPSINLDVPHGVSYSLDATYNKRFGFGASAGGFKTKVKDVDAEVRSWDVRARWFPWAGSFFTGLSYGNQNVAVKTKKDLAMNFQGNTLTILTTVKMQVESRFLTPHIGWMATWDSGFTMGFELGVQLPLSPKATLTTAFDNVSQGTEEQVRDTKDYKDTKKDAEDLGEQLGKKAIPYIDLLRLGWMF